MTAGQEQECVVVGVVGNTKTLVNELDGNEEIKIQGD